MATSGTYVFATNRDKIIRLAMLTIGKLDSQETPTAQEMSDCSDLLNMMVKQWQGKSDFAPGLKTWTRRHGHLFLSATSGQYTVGPSATGWTNNYVQTFSTNNNAGGSPTANVLSSTGMTIGDHFGIELNTGSLFWTTIQNIVGLVITLNANVPTASAANNVVFTYTTAAQQPVEIETVFLRDVFGSDTTLRTLTIQEYDALPAKNQTTNISDPSAIYYEFQLGNSYLFTDVAGAQDVTKHIGITYMEAEQDFVNPADEPCYPQEWYLPLALGLGKLIAPMFNAAWSALNEANFAAALAIARKKEPENITAYFQSGEMV